MAGKLYFPEQVLRRNDIFHMTVMHTKTPARSALKKSSGKRKRLFLQCGNFTLKRVELLLEKLQLLHHEQ